MTRKPVPIFGRCKETSSIAITMNLEFKSTCRSKKHSLLHWNLLMILGLLILIWTSCKKYELTISGMSIRADICQILGEDSQILLCWKRNLQKDKCGPGETDKDSIDYKTRSCIDSSFGRKLWKPLRIERNRNAKEKPKLDTARRLTGIYFIDPNDKEYEDTLQNPRRKLERPVAPAMPCKRNQSSITKVMAKPKIRSEKIQIESHESTRQQVESLQSGSHEERIAGKGFSSMTYFKLVHKFIPMPQAMKIPDAKAAVDEERKNLDTIPAWNLVQVQRESKKVHFATLMDICHLSKIRSWNQKLQKYKGRSVLSGDIIEDDSGAYAVFAEQGSSASQMTAAKKHGRYCKMTRLWPTSSWRSISWHSNKIGRCSQTAQNSEIGMFLMFGYAFHDTNGQNHCEKVKILWYILNGTCTVTHWLDCSGKDNSKTLYWNLDGRKYRIGNACSFIGNKGYFCQYVDDIKMAGKNQNLAPMWKRWWKTWILTNPHHFLYHVHLGCTQRECKPNETVIEQFTKDVWITYFRWSSRKITGMAETSRANSSVVLRYGRTCSKMRWAVEQLWIGKSIQTRWTWICWRIVRSMFTNCLNMLVFGTNWTTWHFNFMVSHQTCKSSHKIDSGMWQTTSKANFLGSSNESLSSNWHVGYTAQHCRLGLFQDSDFAGDLEGSKSTSGGVLCIFGSRTFVPVSWMCKKQTSVSHISTESEIIALDAELRMDGLFALDLWDIVIEVLRTIFKGDNQPILSCSRKLEARSTQAYWQQGNWGSFWFWNQEPNWQKKAEDWSNIWCGQRAHQHAFFPFLWKSVVQRTKPNNETCVQNPQSCSWLVVRQNQFWNPRSKLNMLTPRTSSLTFWPTEVSQEMNGTTFLCLLNIFEFVDIFLWPFQETFSLSVYRAYCVCCHVKKRTRYLEWWLTDGISKTH